MINWIKKNWAIVLLVLITLNWLSKGLFGINTLNLSSPDRADMAYDSYGGSGLSFTSLSSPKIPSSYTSSQIAPSESTNRLIIQDTSMSLMVKNVSTSINEIETLTKNNNGFLVNSNLNRPTESASGTITVRVPESSRAQFLDSLRKLSVKVVSENISGTDVTDQYTDLDARLDVLNQTKQKFEDILAKATQVQDLLTVQRELINLQSQIDQVKGQQKFYEQSAKLSKVTIYLSTDEYSLPYAPSDAWRPGVIFKQAVRSLVGTLRFLGTSTIWLVVYLPIILIAIFLYRFIKRKFFFKTNQLIN